MGKRKLHINSGRVVWAALAGVPCMWPVQVTEEDDNRLQVYCNSDLALLQVRRSQIQEFEPKCGSFEELKACGLKKLKKKPKTLKAFVEDIKWAEESQIFGERAKKENGRKKKKKAVKNNDIEDKNERNVEDRNKRDKRDRKDCDEEDINERDIDDRKEDEFEDVHRYDFIPEKREISVTGSFQENVDDLEDKNESNVEDRNESNVEDRNESIVEDSNESIVEDRNERDKQDRKEDAFEDVNRYDFIPKKHEISVTGSFQENVDDLEGKKENDIEDTNESNVEDINERDIDDRKEDEFEYVHGYDFIPEKREISVTGSFQENVDDLEDKKENDIEDKNESIVEDRNERDKQDRKEDEFEDVDRYDFIPEKCEISVTGSFQENVDDLEDKKENDIEDKNESNVEDRNERDKQDRKDCNVGDRNEEDIDDTNEHEFEDVNRYDFIAEKCEISVTGSFQENVDNTFEDYVSSSDLDDSVLDPDFDLKKFLGSDNEEDIVNQDHQPEGPSHECSTFGNEQEETQSKDDVAKFDEQEGNFCEAVQEVIDLGQINTETFIDDTVKQVEENSDPMERDPPLTKDQCLFDKKYPQVFIKAFERGNEKSKHARPYDTVSACYYCNKLMTNIQSHLERRHRYEAEIKNILHLKRELDELRERCRLDPSLEHTVKKVQRQIRTEQEFIRNKGNDKHNRKVLQKLKGELIISRRTPMFMLDNYGSCPDCKEWINIRENYSKHKRNCVKNCCSSQQFALIHNLIIQGKIAQKASKLLKEEVIPSMIRDDVSEIAMGDELITALGDVWLIKNFSNKLKRKNYASFHMRLAARLLKLLRQKSGLSGNRMYDFLKPLYEDLLISCSLEACGLNTEEELKNPSVAVKLGFDIGRMTAAKFTFAVKTEDKLARKHAKDLVKMLEIDWKTKVNKQARDLLVQRQFNRKVELPFPEDIAKLSRYLVYQIQKLDLNSISQYTFRRAAELAGSRLLLYNKRRPGELSQMTLEVYRDRKDVSENDLSLRRQLSYVDKELLKNQDLIYVRGKQHRGVPVIVTKEVIPLLAYLTDPNVRQNCQIKPDNAYVFANSALGPVDAAVSLDSIKSEADLRCPERVYATNLRKHTATISQVMGLDEHELKWLCNHLGHTVKVHEQHYRQTSGLIERLEIAKLMIIQEKNLVGLFEGKSLSEIDFTDLEDGVLNGDGVLDGDNLDDVETQAADMPNEASRMLLEDYGMDMKERTKKRGQEKVRQRWTVEEEEELRSLFINNFEKKKCPNKTEIEKAVRKSHDNKGQIHRRKPDNIKKKMSNMIIKIKRQDNE